MKHYYADVDKSLSEGHYWWSSASRKDLMIVEVVYCGNKPLVLVSDDEHFIWGQIDSAPEFTQSDTAYQGCLVGPIPRPAVQPRWLINSELPD